MHSNGFVTSGKVASQVNDDTRVKLEDEITNTSAAMIPHASGRFP